MGCSSAPPEAEKAVPEKKAEAPPPEPEPLTGKHYVLIDTTKGKIKLELDADKAPKTVENFLGYVDRKFYDHTIFHRVIKNYFIRAGGYDVRLKRKATRDPVESESDNGLKNVKGAISMHRGEDPQSATTQFMIILRSNPRLDRAYKKGGRLRIHRLWKSRRRYGCRISDRRKQDRAKSFGQERARSADLHQVH